MWPLPEILRVPDACLFCNLCFASPVSCSWRKWLSGQEWGQSVWDGLTEIMITSSAPLEGAAGGAFERHFVGIFLLLASVVGQMLFGEQVQSK